MITKLKSLTMVVTFLLISYSNLCGAPINFIPELLLSAEHTDNLFLDSDDDLKVDDTMTTAGILLNYNVSGKTAGLELNINPSYNSFAKYDELNYWRYFADFHTWKEFSRNTRLELRSSYLETEDPRDSSVIELEEGETEPAIGVDQTKRTRNRYIRNTNNLRLSHQFGPRSNVYLALGYNTRKDIDMPAGALLSDFNAFLPAFGIEYWIESKWGFVLDADLSDRDYVDRDDRKEYYGSLRLIRSVNRHLSVFLRYQHTNLDYVVGATNPDFKIYAPSIGIEYQPSENSLIQIGAGYYFQDFEKSEDDEQSFGDAEINQDWVFRTGFIRFIAKCGYDIEDTGSEDLGLDIYYNGRLEAGYNFTSRFSWDVFAAYRYDDYPNAEIDRTDRAQNAGTGFSYQILRWMNLRLSYEYENIDSDIATEEFTENRAVFTILIAPSSPFRLN